MTLSKFSLISAIAAGTLVLGAPAIAANTAKPVAAKPAPAAKPAAKQMVAAKPAAKPVAKPHAAPARAVAARPAPAGRMVQAKLSNGKVVTYNCSLPGNQTKQACKR